MVALCRCVRNCVRTPGTPPHDCCRRRQTAFQDFIPADHFFSVIIKELLHVMNKPGLQLFFCLQPVIFHSFLAIRTFLPVCFFYFISSQMDIFIREKRNDFAINILTKFKSRVFTRTNRRRKSRSPPCLIKTRNT